MHVHGYSRQGQDTGMPWHMSMADDHSNKYNVKQYPKDMACALQQETACSACMCTVGLLVPSGIRQCY